MKVKSEGQIFKCDKCRNEVIVTEVGGGELVCCSQPMTLADKEIDYENEDDHEEESE